jgi:hypothetical protein
MLLNINPSGGFAMAESKKAGGKNKAVLRRDFLVGSGAAMAAGAMGACASGSAVAFAQTTTAAKPTYAASTGYIVYDSRLCFGCCRIRCQSGSATESVSQNGSETSGEEGRRISLANGYAGRILDV